GRLVFVNADQPHPKLEGHTTTRTATLHGPGELSEPELMRMAGEVFDANKPLPGNHYRADDPTVDRDAMVREIADEMRGLHLVRVQQVVKDANGVPVSDAVIA